MKTIYFILILTFVLINFSWSQTTSVLQLEVIEIAKIEEDISHQEKRYLMILKECGVEGEQLAKMKLIFESQKSKLINSFLELNKIRKKRVQNKLTINEAQKQSSFHWDRIKRIQEYTHKEIKKKLGGENSDKYKLFDKLIDNKEYSIEIDSKIIIGDTINTND